MGSFHPLPALDVRPPQPQESPLDVMSRVMQIKSFQQGQQLQAEQLKGAQIENQMRSLGAADEVNARSAFHDWDPSTGTDGLMALTQKYGVGPKTFTSLATGILDMKQKVATLQKDQIDNLQKTNDMARGKVMGVLNAPGDKRLAAWQELKQQVMTDPQLAGFRQFMPHIPDDAVPSNEDLQLISNQLALGSTLAKEHTEEMTAQGRLLGAQTEAEKLKAELPGGALYSPSETNLATRASQGDQQAQGALNTLTQQRSRVAAAEAGAKVSAEMKAYGAANPAVAQVPPHLVAPAIADYNKAGTEFAEAQNAAEDMRTFLDMARSGNKVAYAYSPVEGVLQFNTARGIKRVNMAEIESYGGAGSALDRIKGYLGKQTSGASIPADVLNDMESLHGRIAENAGTLYKNKLAVINQAYGSKFQPVDLGAAGASVSGNAPTAGATKITATGPNGHQIEVRNGQWVDSKTGQPIQ